VAKNLLFNNYSWLGMWLITPFRSFSLSLSAWQEMKQSQPWRFPHVSCLHIPEGCGIVLATQPLRACSEARHMRHIVGNPHRHRCGCSDEVFLSEVLQTDSLRPTAGTNRMAAYTRISLHRSSFNPDPYNIPIIPAHYKLLEDNPEGIFCLNRCHDA